MLGKTSRRRRLAEAFALADVVGVLEAGRLIQLGSPEEIYQSPASAFVARFTGLAGELVVRVTSKSGPHGTIEVEPVNRALQLARPLHARAPTNGHAGGSALLTVRPTAVRICAPDLGDHHILGTVTDVAFRDRGYEHAVDVPGQGIFSGIFGAWRAARGETVGLHLESAGCMIFPSAHDGPDDANFAVLSAAPAGG